MQIICPHCQVKLNAKPEAAGNQIKCPKCGNAMVIPSPERVPNRSSSGAIPPPKPEAATATAPNIPSPSIAPIEQPLRPIRRASPHRYPTMLMASRVYRILGWVTLILGILGSLLLFISGFALMQQADSSSQLTVIASALVPALGSLLSTVIAVISFWFLAEAIKWMIDLEEHSRRTSECLRDLTDKAM